MFEFEVPDLGEDIESAEVVRVLVAEGDIVEAEQEVLELETDKATFELPCPRAGKVVTVHVQEGDEVRVGQKVLTLEEQPTGDRQGDGDRDEPSQEEADDGPESASEEAASAEADEDGEQAAGDDVAAEAEHGGAGARKGDDEAAGEKRDDADEDRRSPTASEQQRAADEATGEDRGAEPKQDRTAELPAFAAPSVRQLARELGVDLRRLEASATTGRISEGDVRHAAEEGGQRTDRSADRDRWGPVERIRPSKVMRTGAERLTEAWRTIPHVTQHDLLDVTATEQARRAYQEQPGEEGPSVTLTVVLIRAVVAALGAHPRFNASLDDETGEVIHKRYVNLGIAVDTEDGLLVPVLHHAERRSLRDIATELEQLVRGARERTLKREQLQGASFSISNQGGLGGTAFTPIINPPEVAILGVSRTRREGADDRTFLPVSLSYDHRVNNGADAVRFLTTLGQLLASPFRLLMES